ncbi:MAG TPA: hypothetical protein VGI10_15345 [Polyangiaceae bacterium]
MSVPVTVTAGGDEAAVGAGYTAVIFALKDEQFTLLSKGTQPASTCRHSPTPVLPVTCTAIGTK